MTWDIRGKTALVTGATSGIGLEASIELARRGAEVVIVGRDPARTQRAVGQLNARTGRQASHFICDFSSQESIRHLAESVHSRNQRLDVLINNAGGVSKTRRLTPDGIETTFATNHLGYFLLTNLLLDLIKKSAPARIVTVASAAHRQGTLDFSDLGFERGYGLMKAYSRSKLANVLFAAELARRLEGTDVTSNSLHPGAVNTNIWSGAPSWSQPIIGLLKPFFLSAAEGGARIVQLAASPELSGITGCYFEKGRPVSPSKTASDAALAARLWEESVRLVGVSAAA